MLHLDPDQRARPGGYEGTLLQEENIMRKDGYTCLLRSAALSQIRLSNMVLDCFPDPVSDEEIRRTEHDIYEYVNDRLPHDTVWSLYTSELIGRAGSEFSESDFEEMFEELLEEAFMKVIG